MHYAYVNAVFNISSDLMMMGIPLPLLIKSRLPMKHKIAVCGVFLMVKPPTTNRTDDADPDIGSLRHSCRNPDEGV